MVTFRCKQSGNFVRFSDDEDIADMRKDTSYEEIKPESLEPKVAVETKQRGRPKKNDQPVVL